MNYYFRYLLTLFAIMLVAGCSSEDGNRSDAGKQPESMKSAIQIVQTLEQSFLSKATRAESNMNYPDYYGGAYINKEGDLIVLVKGKTDLYKQELSVPADLSIRRSQVSGFVIRFKKEI